MTRPFVPPRRTFVWRAGSALACALIPRHAFAQASGRIHRIGILADFDPPTAQQVSASPFLAALRDSGFVEGKNIEVVRRYGGKGQRERLHDMVKELIDAKVDVIAVAGGDVAIRAARDATATIPIVMMFGRDPVGVGFAASLPRPGRNVTGVTIDVDPEENSKRVQLLKEAVPSMKTLVFIADAAWGDFGDRDPYVVAIKTSAHSMGVVVTNVIVLKAAAEVPAALDVLRKARPHGLMIANGPALDAHAARVHEFLLDQKLPTLVMSRAWINRGVLMTHGIDGRGVQRQAGGYVARILKGANPATMPIARPTKQELVLNRRTATALGLTFPASLILSADEIIE
jgi:putative ABC transport system substrate-binding protein